MKKEERTIFSYWVASIISLICLIFIFIYWRCPARVDKITLVLLVIGLAPWLTKFFTKIKIGDLEAHSVGRSQGSTDTPLPPTEIQANTVITLKGSSLSPDAKKILATLWRYQKQRFKDDYTNRWTFKLFPHSLQYTAYILGVGELLKIGLISISPKNEQCMLTNEGITFVEKENELQNYTDIYKF